MSTSDLDTLVSGPVAAAGPSRWCFCYWWLALGERNLSAAVTHAGKNLSNWPLQSTNCRRLSRSFLLPLIDLPPGTSPVHSTRLSLFLATVGWSPAPFKPVEIPLPEQAQGRVPTFLVLYTTRALVIGQRFSGVTFTFSQPAASAHNQ